MPSDRHGMHSTMPRLYPTTIFAGARAYNWRTRQPTDWHPGRITDVELFCRRLLDDALNQWGMFLRHHEYEDTLQELIILVNQLEKRFDPDKADTFSGYASWIIRLRATDYGPRRVLGRHGTRTHNYMSPSENPYAEVEQTFSPEFVDFTDDSGAFVRGLLAGRDSEVEEEDRRVRRGEDGSSPPGD